MAGSAGLRAHCGRDARAPRNLDLLSRVSHFCRHVFLPRFRMLWRRLTARRWFTPRWRWIATRRRIAARWWIVPRRRIIARRRIIPRWGIVPRRGIVSDRWVVTRRRIVAWWRIIPHRRLILPRRLLVSLRPRNRLAHFSPRRLVWLFTAIANRTLGTLRSCAAFTRRTVIVRRDRSSDRHMLAIAFGCAHRPFICLRHLISGVAV